MSSNKFYNKNGSTLIEALVAIVILTVGIITVMVMQANAIKASSTAINRTEANNVSIALIETLKKMAFTDANLAQTTATTAELTNVATSQDLNTLIAAGKVRTFTAAFTDMSSVLTVGASNGLVIDHTGITYQLAWAVQDNVVAGDTINKTLWVFMTWNTQLGQNTLKMTTIKFNNTSL